MAREIIPTGDAEDIGPTKPPEQTPRAIPDRSQFESYMEQPSTPPPGAPPSGPTQVTPLELSRGAPQAGSPTLDSLLSQAYSSDGYINELQQNLRTPNLRFRRSEQYLLRNKLSEANTHLTAASEKIGAQVLAPQGLPKGANPVERFINLVTHGQSQLTEAKQKLLDLKDTEGQLRPGDLMLVQVKLAQAQQELEYASILLSKVVDVIKQMINIQL